MTRSGDAVLPPQFAAFAEGLQAAFHYICYEVSVDVPEWARDIALSSCCHDQAKQYDLYVAVVMPDHVHLILTPLIDGDRHEVFSLVAIMRAIKGASAHMINRQLGKEGAVWQEESFDHVLRSSEGLDAKIDYVLQNPVRRGLVEDWGRYRWGWRRAARDEAEMTVRQVT